LTFVGRATRFDRFFGCQCGCVVIVRSDRAIAGMVQSEAFYSCTDCVMRTAGRDAIVQATLELPPHVRDWYIDLSDATCAATYLFMPNENGGFGTPWQ
jgi:hypothetical protein